MAEVLAAIDENKSELNKRITCIDHRKSKIITNQGDDNGIEADDSNAEVEEIESEYCT